MIWKEYGLNKTLIISYASFILIIMIILFSIIASILTIIDDISVLVFVWVITSISSLVLMVYLFRAEVRRYHIFKGGCSAIIPIRNGAERMRITNGLVKKLSCDRRYFSIPIAEKLSGQSFYRIDSDDDKIIQIFPTSPHSFSIILSPLSKEYIKKIESIIASDT